MMKTRNINKMQYGTVIKGIENTTGSNNCFLNVILQSFHHLNSFRESFQINSYAHHHESNSSCLVCEIRVKPIQNLMLEYEYSDAPTLNIEKVRKALQTVCEIFAINSKACAVEAFEEILKYFHSTYENCIENCYAHDVFGFSFTEETFCSCNSSSGQIMSDFIIRAYTTELFQLAKNSKDDKLDILLGKSLASQSYLLPCAQCNKFIFTKKCLKSKPKVFFN